MLEGVEKLLSVLSGGVTWALYTHYFVSDSQILQAIDCSKVGMFNVLGCGVEKLLSVLSGGGTYLEILRFWRFGKNAGRGWKTVERIKWGGDLST